MTATSLARLSADISSIVTAISPGVVAIRSPHARCSGFVWKPGLVVTANDALADDENIAIFLPGGTRVEATLAGRDPSTDIAVLRVPADTAQPADLHPVLPSVGAITISVGSDRGNALAALGIVSTVGPAWQSMRGGDINARIELDLSMRRVAEGGLAVDASGQAFGMTVFGPRRRVLVIPAETISHVAGKIETDGKIERGYLGLALQPVRVAESPGFGLMVMGVEQGGPGAKAGVQQGDVIVRVNGREIASPLALQRSLGPSRVGTTLAMDVRRSGTDTKLELLVGTRPAT
ncbi:MAG: serine protease [Hyphomicrobiales bacterium]|nr:MAG: serine protease [Hyphomicrobiales bacterium]